MDLSAYLNFNVTLRYDLLSKKIQVTDTSAYPPGVKSGVSGILTIKQPDGITRTGSFASPDIVYNGSELTTGQVDLRLSTSNQPQNGGYTVTYTVRHADYDDTTITKTFSFSYKEPVLNISKSFDVFTPSLRAVDSTNYTHDGLSLQSVTRSWSAIIGSLGTKLGSEIEFDLSLGGEYYDAEYAITLETIAEWDITAYPFVTIFDKILKITSGAAKAPAVLDQLREDLSVFKIELDSLINNPYLYDIKNNRYTKASLLLQQMIDLGRSGATENLQSYHAEFVREINDGQVPEYSHTELPIPPYDWGVSAGSTSWESITNKPYTEVVQWITGSPSFPAAGESAYTDPRLADKKIIYFRNYIPQYSGNPGGGNSYYEKLSSGSGSDTINVYGPFETGDINMIIVLGI